MFRVIGVIGGILLCGMLVGCRSGESTVATDRVEGVEYPAVSDGPVRLMYMQEPSRVSVSEEEQPRLYVLPPVDRDALTKKKIRGYRGELSSRPTQTLLVGEVRPGVLWEWAVLDAKESKISEGVVYPLVRLERDVTAAGSRSAWSVRSMLANSAGVDAAPSGWNVRNQLPSPHMELSDSQAGHGFAGDGSEEESSYLTLVLSPDELKAAGGMVVLRVEEGPGDSRSYILDAATHGQTGVRAVYVSDSFAAEKAARLAKELCRIEKVDVDEITLSIVFEQIKATNSGRIPAWRSFQ